MDIIGAVRYAVRCKQSVVAFNGRYDEFMGILMSQYAKFTISIKDVRLPALGII